MLPPFFVDRPITETVKPYGSISSKLLKTFNRNKAIVRSFRKTFSIENDEVGPAEFIIWNEIDAGRFPLRPIGAKVSSGAERGK